MERVDIRFSAMHVSGAKRGRDIGTPTINLALESVPETLHDGIYACRVRLDDEPQTRDAVMHLGPRPVFKDTRSCEVHVLDEVLTAQPAIVRVAVSAYLREVRDFPSVDALKTQIAEDIAQARAILAA